MKADYKKLLIASCVTLGIFYLFVILTGKTLIISTEYQNFELFCNWVDSHTLASYMIRFITYYFNWVFAFYTIHKSKIFGYKPLGFTIFIFIFWVVKELFKGVEIVNYIDFVVFGGIILSKVKCWRLGVVTCLYTLAVVIVTSTIKGVFILGIDFTTISTLEHLVFGIDLYLMSIIFYLYIIKRERSVSYEIS